VTVAEIEGDAMVVPIVPVPPRTELATVPIVVSGAVPVTNVELGKKVKVDALPRVVNDVLLTAVPVRPSTPVIVWPGVMVTRDDRIAKTVDVPPTVEVFVRTLVKTIVDTAVERLGGLDMTVEVEALVSVMVEVSDRVAVSVVDSRSVEVLDAVPSEVVRKGVTIIDDTDVSVAEEVSVTRETLVEKVVSVRDEISGVA